MTYDPDEPVDVSVDCWPLFRHLDNQRFAMQALQDSEADAQRVLSGCGVPESIDGDSGLRARIEWMAAR